VKFLSAIENTLAKVETGLIVLFLGTMVILSFVQVILRDMFSLGFLWADPLLRYMVVWVGFLGAVLATKEEKHLGIEFLNRFLAPRTLHLVKTLVEGFAAVVAFLLTQAAFQFLLEGILEGEKDLFDLPKRLYFAIIPVGFGLISLHFCLRTIRHFSNFLRKQERPEIQAPSSLL